MATAPQIQLKAGIYEGKLTEIIDRAISDECAARGCAKFMQKFQCNGPSTDITEGIVSRLNRAQYQEPDITKPGGF